MSSKFIEIVKNPEDPQLTIFYYYYNKVIIGGKI